MRHRHGDDSRSDGEEFRSIIRKSDSFPVTACVGGRKERGKKEPTHKHVFASILSAAGAGRLTDIALLPVISQESIVSVASDARQIAPPNLSIT